MKLLSLLFILLATLSPTEVLEKGEAFFDADRYLEARAFLDENLGEVRRKADPETLSEILSLLATTNLRLGDFDQALRHQEECYNLDLEIGDPANISSSLNNLAGINLAIGNADQAEKLILDAIRTEETLGNTAALAIRYGMASDILLQQGRAAEAAAYSEKAYQLDKEAGRTYQTGIRASQLAESCLRLKEYDRAWALLQEAADIFQADNHLHSLAVCRRQQGEFARMRGFNAMAANYYREALKLNEETGNLYQEKLNCEDLALLLRNSAPAEAFDYMAQCKALSDTIFRQETARMQADFNTRYDLAGKELELQHQQETLRMRNLLITLLAVVLALFAGVIVVLMRLSAIRKRNNLMLQHASDLKDRMIALGPAATDDPETTKKMNDIVRDLSALGQAPEQLLTQREREVARLAADGLLSKEIADRLHISQRTVETHKSNIFKKLGINSTVELVRLMNQLDL